MTCVYCRAAPGAFAGWADGGGARAGAFCAARSNACSRIFTIFASLYFLYLPFALQDVRRILARCAWRTASARRWYYLSAAWATLKLNSHLISYSIRVAVVFARPRGFLLLYNENISSRLLARMLERERATCSCDSLPCITPINFPPNGVPFSLLPLSRSLRAHGRR